MYSIRSIIPVTVLVAGVATAAAVCFAHGTCVRGNGNIKTEERTVAQFTGVEIGGFGVLRVHHGDKPVVRITTDENLLPLIESNVHGGVLHLGIDDDDDRTIRGMTKLEIDVTTAALESLDLSGAVKASVDRFAGDRIQIENSGAVKLDAELQYKTIELDLSGGGEVALRGSASDVHIDGSGATRITASGLQARSIEADFSGAARADLRASESLDLDVSGAGHVRYWGNPRVTQDVSGAVKIERAGD